MVSICILVWPTFEIPQFVLAPSWSKWLPLGGRGAPPLFRTFYDKQWHSKVAKMDQSDHVRPFDVLIGWCPFGAHAAKEKRGTV